MSHVVVVCTMLGQRTGLQREETVANGLQVTANGASAGVDAPSVTPVLWVIREKLNSSARSFAAP
jgi:hypothetical protein